MSGFKTGVVLATSLTAATATTGALAASEHITSTEQQGNPKVAVVKQCNWGVPEATIIIDGKAGIEFDIRQQAKDSGNTDLADEIQSAQLEETGFEAIGGTDKHGTLCGPLFSRDKYPRNGNTVGSVTEAISRALEQPGLNLSFGVSSDGPHPNRHANSALNRIKVNAVSLPNPNSSATAVFFTVNNLASEGSFSGVQHFTREPDGAWKPRREPASP